MSMAAQGSAEEVSLRCEGARLTEVYCAPAVFLLGGLGAEGDSWEPEPLLRSPGCCPAGGKDEETPFPSFNNKSGSPEKRHWPQIASAHVVLII